MTELAEIIARWDANEGKPYKGIGIAAAVAFVVFLNFLAWSF